MAKHVMKFVFCVVFAAAVAIPSFGQVVVEPHWTPYSPPTEYPAGTNVYIIQKGDTLWDLAGQFLDNPYLWPQIWKANDYITDSHWIYPGDPLVMTPVDVVAPDTTVMEDTTVDEALDTFVEEDVPVQTEAVAESPVEETQPKAKVMDLAFNIDIECAPFVYETADTETVAKVSGLAAIVGGEDPIVDFSTGDVVYLDGGTANGLVAGKEYQIVHSGNWIKHPKTLAPIGIGQRRLGRLKILLAHENASTAKIIYACSNIAAGDYLVDFEPEPIPLTIDYEPYPRYAEPIMGDPEYFILVPDNEDNLFTDSVAVITIENSADVVPGDMFIMYKAGKLDEFPVYLGEAAVLFTGEKTATVRVVHSVLEAMWRNVYLVRKPAVQ